MQENKMTLLQHFLEFKKRILYVFVFFTISFLFSFFISDYFIEFFSIPFTKILPNTPLVYNNLTDGFFIKFSISGFTSLLFTVPFFLWHLWKYISPGLYKNEKRVILPIILMSPILFLFGGVFAFYFLYPLIFEFFVNLNNSKINNLFLPNINNYLEFSIGLIKVFGVAFQMPLILFMLNKIGFLPKASLIAFRKYAYVIIFIISAILTPPDVLSQFMLAIPMIVLFEISILFMK